MFTSPSSSSSSSSSSSFAFAFAFAALALSFASLAAVACGAPASESSASSGQAITAPESNVQPEFAECAADSDCVAVAQAGCCHNGWLASVSQESADDYAAANACPQPQPVLCPMYVVADSRIAQCNWDTKACEMIAVEKIDCGDIHTCPDGYSCDRGSERGKCVVATPAPVCDDAGSGSVSSSSVAPHAN